MIKDDPDTSGTLFRSMIFANEIRTCFAKRLKVRAYTYCQLELGLEHVSFDASLKSWTASRTRRLRDAVHGISQPGA